MSKGKRQYGLWLALALTVVITLWTALTNKDEATGLVAQHSVTRSHTADARRPPAANMRANPSHRAMSVTDAAPASMLLDLAPLQ